MQVQFINFLREELDISEDSIELALNSQEKSLSKFLLILWQCGSISFKQLEIICNWLESKNLSLEHALQQVHEQNQLADIA